MACIIKMSSNEFLNKFIKKFDYRKFNFLLISEDIKTIKKYKNVYAIPTLIPPPNIISEFVSSGYSDRYVKKYADYLQTPRVEAMITILVKLCIIDNSNVVLLCTKAEDEYNYLDIICQYIEQVYGANTYTYKEYKKNPEKCEEVTGKQKKKVTKVLEEKLRNIRDIELEPPKMKKKEAKAIYKEYNRKELKQILKRQGIKCSDKASKKDLFKLVMKKLG